MSSDPSALKRASDYQSETIFNDLLADIDLGHGLSARGKNAASEVGETAKAHAAELGLDANQAFIGELLALMGA